MPDAMTETGGALPRLEALPASGVPTRAGEAGLRIVLSGPGHRAAQGELYDRCFHKADGARVLPWRYDDCPHGATIATVGLDDEGALLASYAAQPRRVHFRGESLGAEAVAQTGDVMTSPDLRSRGVFTDLHWAAMDAAQRRGWPAAWGLPNEHSGYIFFDKLRWRHAGHIAPWHFVFGTSAESRAIRHLHGRLARWGTPWAALRGRVARARSGLDGATVEDPWRTFPEDVHVLSSFVEERFDWMVHRDRAYLEWRYQRAPSGRFAALGVRDRSGALAGYAVIQRPLVARGPRTPAEALGFVVDLVGADPGAEQCTLHHALRALERSGAAVVRCYAMCGSHWESVLRRGGFSRPRHRKEVGAYPLIPDHPLADATMDTSRWSFMDGDRDDEIAR